MHDPDDQPRHGPPARVPRALLLAACALAAGLLGAGPALAAGGTAIASAPLVVPGAQESANSAGDSTVLGTSGSQVTGCWVDFELWRLPLQAGDVVTITGEPETPATNVELGVFPAGTTAATFAGASAVTTGFLEPGRTIHFTAASSGTYVLAGGPNCYNSNPGPYRFVATVAAGSAPASLSLPALVALPASGTFNVAVHGALPAGASFELIGVWKDAGATAASPHTLASAVARGGSVRFAYRLPAGVAGTTVELRAVALGSAASAVKQASASFRVAAG